MNEQENVFWILNHKAEYHVFVICNEFVNKIWLEGFPLNVTCVIVHFDIKQSWQFLLACDLSFCQFILTYIKVSYFWIGHSVFFNFPKKQTKNFCPGNTLTVASEVIQLFLPLSGSRQLCVPLAARCRLAERVYH